MQQQLSRQGQGLNKPSPRCSRTSLPKAPAALPRPALVPAAQAPTSASSRISRLVAAAEPAQKQAAAPAASTSPASPKDAAPKQTKEWYAVVANCEFFFNDPQNESLAEQLRERVRFFKEINREIDFYIVPEPKWLDQKYPEEAKKVKRPCAAIMSTDKTWIVFMKLRLDRCLRFDLGAVPDAEALAVGGKVPEFEKPEKWTAPYPGYTPGWWEKFYPQ